MKFMDNDDKSKDKESPLDKDFFLNLVNQHHDEIVEENKRKSLEQTEVKYTEKKKVPLKKLRLVLIGTAIVVALIVTDLTNQFDIPEKMYVNGRIEYYQSMMDVVHEPGKNDHSIEAFKDDNRLNGSDPKVDYEDWNDDNFYNHIMEASRQEDPLVEVRCALIGAYHVINEPYRQQQFKILFNKIKNNQEFLDNMGLDGSDESLWQMLGYASFDDFQKNIKKDTIDLYKKESDEKNGKRM